MAVRKTSKRAVRTVSTVSAPATLDPAVIVRDLLQVIDMLMPGMRHIAVQDYALVNEAPIRARQLLDQLSAAEKSSSST